MGAVAGSWAGLHGPGEKTIKKTGQSGPGPYKGPGVWDRGPGQRAAGHPSRVGGPGVPGPAGKATGHKQGARGQGSGWGASWGPPSTAARMGCLGTRLPSLEGPKELVRTPAPRKPPHPPCGGFWSVLELAPFGDSFPKTWATPHSGGAGKLQATTVCDIRMGCLYRPWTPPSTSEHLGTG